MKTQTILIAAAALVGGVILYEKLKPAPAPTSPFVNIGTGVGTAVQGLASLFTSKTAPSSQTTPTKTALGSIDLDQSAYSKAVPGWDSLETET